MLGEGPRFVLDSASFVGKRSLPAENASRLEREHPLNALLLPPPYSVAIGRFGTVWLIPTEEASRLEREHPLRELTSVG